MKNNVSFWKYIILFVLAFYFLYLLSPILTPFILGILIAYLADPLVCFLQRLKIPRTLSVVLVFLVFIVIILGLVFMLLPQVLKQIDVFIDRVPLAIDWVQDVAAPWVRNRFGLHETANFDLSQIKGNLAKVLPKAGNVMGRLTSTLTNSTLAIIVFVTNLVLVPVVAFYLLRDWRLVVDKTFALFSPSLRPKARALATECDEVVGAFLKGQLLVMLSLGVVYSLGLWAIDLNLALLIGMLSGLAAIVPYLGFCVGIITATLAMFLQTHAIGDVLLVWLVYSIGQCVESMVLTPWLVGDKVGLHPVAVIFAVMAGGVLLGFFGILIAIPLAAVIMIVLKHVMQYESKASCS